MSQDELIALAKQKASQHDLFPELVCAVVEQESSWDPSAIRYETEFYVRYVLPLLAQQKIADETEARARAFSWGLMQVMGETARENGFAGKFLGELLDPETNLEIGCRILERKIAAAEGNVRRALELWNGGSNPDYAAQVLARAKMYKDEHL